MGNIYILLTKCDGRTERISARGLGRYVPEQAWLIRDLLNDCMKKALKSAGSLGTMPGPILREYWTGNRAF